MAGRCRGRFTRTGIEAMEAKGRSKGVREKVKSYPFKRLWRPIAL
jgi:hypothetical protein